ncbi:MAG: hypothetical protein IIZ61_01540 [Lachnospiraceae bacterium]|nr:hypothetical protein [Lachnospiraceae bacterium]
MKKNIRFILLGELILFVAVFLFTIWSMDRSISGLALYIDIPSIIFILIVLIPGLIIMGEWKNFIKSFSVGIKEFSLLELKDIVIAVSAAQKLTILGALIAIITSIVLVLKNLDDLQMLGPCLAVCCLSGLYAAVIEFFLLPLRLNAEHKMNEEMDFGDE